jgi:Rrf2 family transcriptional regulator, nitric oxide-sensitive transcriptional repressor
MYINKNVQLKCMFIGAAFRIFMIWIKHVEWMNVKTCALHRKPGSMRLTAYTDYALRTLMFLAVNRDRLVTIQEIADAHGIAKNHLTKVVHQLGQLGYVETLRGRSGGLRLGCEPEDVTIGAVVRETESDFFMAACFDDSAPVCIYAGACGLQGTLDKATRAFLDVLDNATLDMVLVREQRKKAGRGGQAIELHFKPAAKARKVKAG